MKKSIYDLAQIVQGEISTLLNVIITGVASFELADTHQITFADNAKFLKQVHLSKAGAILVPKHYYGSLDNIIKVENPRLAFAKLLNLFYQEEKPEHGIHITSSIDDSSCISLNAHIGAFVHIGKQVSIGKHSIINPGSFIGDYVTIGNNVTINPNVTIMQNCFIGNNVVIHSGTVIGSDGFGFISKKQHYIKMPHIGIVQIDDNVEIGACNTIDRATLGKTWIRNGVKTDNMVHIGHNVTIGKNTLIISNVAIAGSSRIGDNVIIAGKAGIAGHLVIGNNAKIGPKAGVTKHVLEDEIVSGSPAMPHRDWLKVQRTLPNIPNMAKTIKKLEQRIKYLENKQKIEDEKIMPSDSND